MKSLQSETSAGPDPLEDERIALVERVAYSHTFQKSQKLREFFQFVCDCSIRHGASEEVKEQQIGVHIFHRRPDYNTSEDSIVRVQARELRKRLATYFETEGKNEPVVIAIPKGGYLPVFVPAESKSRAEQESLSTPGSGGDLVNGSDAIARQASSARRHLVRWLVAVLAGILLFVAGWAISAEMRKPSPAVSQLIANRNSYSFYEELLGSIGRDGSDTLLVLSNPKVLLYLVLNPSAPANSGDVKLVPVPPALRKQLVGAINLNVINGPQTYLKITDSTFTGMGEAANAYNIGRMMSAMGRSVRLTQARFLNWDAAVRENLIVLGNPGLNSWTGNNLASSNFILMPGAIRNLSPLPGESAIYHTSVDSKGHAVEDYGIINLSTTASGSRVLILAGSLSAGTYGAGNFFTDPGKMRVVYDRLRAMQTGATFPQNWEALIRISIRDDIPVETTLVAVRGTGSPK